MGITVVNVPGYSTDATVELTLGLILSHLRRLPECYDGVRAGGWPSPLQEDLQSKRVAIIGTGKIGMRLAEILHALRVKSLIGFSRTHRPGFEALGGTYTDSLASLFLEADIICVSVALTAETKGLVSESLMQLLRPS